MMSIPSFSLEGKVAIVTGGRRGIGKAIALCFAEAGADVVVCDRIIEDGELESTAKEIQALGRRSVALRVDITVKSDVESMVEQTVKEFGTIDILVNNAAIIKRVPLFEVDEDDWDRVIDTDLKGYFLCCQAVAKRMIERKKGNIINMASVAALKGLSKRGAYNIAKAGVIMLTRGLAWDLGRYNIRVNAIAPAIVKTEMARGFWEDPKALAAEEARIPLGRLAETNDIIGPALFLASDASRFITGHTIIVDGGQLA